MDKLLIEYVQYVVTKRPAAAVETSRTLPYSWQVQQTDVNSGFINDTLVVEAESPIGGVVADFNISEMLNTVSSIKLGEIQRSRDSRRGC